jgi:hypothetical protein
MTGERRVVLRDERDGSDRRFLEARIAADGKLVLEGQDLGPGVESAFGEGCREYEWRRTIEPLHVPLLLKALGAELDADVLQVLARVAPTEIERCIREFEIPSEWWSRIGD